jgi:hypothetical protein
MVVVPWVFRRGFSLAILTTIQRHGNGTRAFWIILDTAHHIFASGSKSCSSFLILSPFQTYPKAASPALSPSTMPEHDALISEYSHLKQFPREKDALHALQKIASLVKPIMRARGWTVGTLAEFYPDSHNLLGTQGYTSPHQ